MLRCWFLFLLLAGSAGAQFTTPTPVQPFAINSLVPNGDGSVLYFSSALKLAGDDSEPAWPKIFRYSQDTGQLTLAKETTSYQKLSSTFGSTPYMLIYPDLSSDGNTLAYTAAGDPCGQGSTCITYFGALANVFIGGVPANLQKTGTDNYGTIRISRNGRFGFLYPYDEGTAITSSRLLLDLETNTSVSLTSPVSPIGLYGDGYQTISDSGTVLNISTLYAPGMAFPLAMSNLPLAERMSGDGQRIVYESNPKATQHSLVLYNVASGQENTLTRGPAGAAFGTVNGHPAPTYQFWLSDDGSLVSYLDEPTANSLPQVYLVRTYSPFEITQLTAEPDGIASAVLSGSKNLVYALTLTNRLICVQTANGSVREISGPLAVYSGSGAPGSLVQLTGTGDPQAWGSAQVQIGGINAPLLGSTASSVTVQIPWELVPPANPTSANPLRSPVPLTITYNGANVSQFEQTSIVQIYAFSPQYLAVAHQDFHGVVTSADPARAGEIVHVYMAGLGPVTPAIATGVITPADTLYTVTNPPTCNFSVNTGVTVVATPLFAGLAPGLLGTYQVDVQLPPKSTAQDWTFGCNEGPLQSPGGPYGVTIPTVHS